MGSQRNIILQYLENTVLPNITTANGYNFTLATKERGLKHYEDMSDSEFPAIFLASADEVRDNITHRHFKSDMTCIFIGYVKAAGDQSIQQELDKLIEDLMKAIFDGPTVGAADPTQGNRVSWTGRVVITTDEGDMMPHAMFKMEVNLSYVQPGVSP